jgi:DNA polymerase III epsilon subunit-like protein
LSAHALGDVASALGVEDEIRARCEGLDWHDALFDAVACLAVLQRVITTCASPDFTVGQLLSMDTQAYHRRRALLQTARSVGWAT